MPTSRHPQLLLDNQLCFALYAASLAMTRLYKPLLDELGLTYPQYLVLLCLWEQDGLGVSELGERLTLDSGTLTPLVKRLESLGLVQRERSRTDERRVAVQLTPTGVALQDRAAAVPACVAQAVNCNFHELQALTQQLQTLRQRLALATSPATAEQPTEGNTP